MLIASFSVGYNALVNRCAMISPGRLLIGGASLAIRLVCVRGRGFRENRARIPAVLHVMLIIAGN